MTEFENAANVVNTTATDHSVYEKNLKLAETALKNRQRNEARAAAQAEQAAARQQAIAANQYQQSQYQQPPAGYAFQPMPAMPMQMPMAGGYGYGAPMMPYPMMPTMPYSMPMGGGYASGDATDMQLRAAEQNTLRMQQQTMQMQMANAQQRANTMQMSTALYNQQMQNSQNQMWSTMNTTMSVTKRLTDAAGKLQEARRNGDPDAIASAQKEYNDASAAMQNNTNALSMQAGMLANQNQLWQQNHADSQAIQADTDAKLKAIHADAAKQQQHDTWFDVQMGMDSRAQDAAYENQQMESGKIPMNAAEDRHNDQLIKDAANHQAQEPAQ